MYICHLLNCNGRYCPVSDIIYFNNITKLKEMVSLGDTAISLHIPQTATLSVVVKAQSAKICLEFQLGERGSVAGKIQSTKICLNFNFGGRGGVYSVVVKPKVARSGYIFYFGGVGVGGVGGWVLYQIPEQGVLANLVKKFLKSSLPLHHR